MEGVRSNRVTTPPDDGQTLRRLPKVPAQVRCGLSRRQRLLSPRLFEEAFASGHQWPTRTLVLWIRTTPDTSRRLGVVASKRTFRRAVDRNRARRLLREAFRLHRNRLPEQVDVVLLARHRILKARRQDVERDLIQSFEAAHLVARMETSQWQG